MGGLFLQDKTVSICRPAKSPTYVLSCLTPSNPLCPTHPSDRINTPHRLTLLDRFEAKMLFMAHGFSDGNTLNEISRVVWLRCGLAPFLPHPITCDGLELW